MTSQPVSSVPSAAVQLDLPPIPAASQIDQQALPFSQLLQQAQPSPPTSAAPPSPPPPSQASNPPPPNTVDANNNGAPDTSDSASSQTSSADGETAPPANGASSDPDASNGAASNLPPANGDAQPSKVPSHGGAHGTQQTTSAKNGQDTEAKHAGDEASSANAATAAATVVAPKPVSQRGDQEKSSKQTADNGTTKTDAEKSGDSGAAPVVPVTTDGSAQVVANAVTVPAPADDSVKTAKNVKETSSVKAAGSAKQVASTAGLAQGKRQTGAAQQGSTTSKNATLPGDAPAVTSRLQPGAKTPDASSTVTGQTSKFADAQTAVSQSNDLTVSNSGEVAPASPAVQAVATVAATQSEVASTITVDQSSQTAAATQNGADPAPTSTSTSPNNAPPATPSAFASSMSQTASQGTSGSTGLNTVDRARFVQRVARAFQTVGSDGGQMRLRLSPPELGSLQMQISVKQGALTAHIQTDNSTAQQALLDSLPDLRDRLAQQDIHIERFDVELTGQSSGGLPQSPQGNPDFDQAARRSNAGGVASPPATPVESNASVSASPVLTNGTLNVVV